MNIVSPMDGSELRAPAPIRVLVDLERMQPGSGHGGIKPGVYAFLGELARLGNPEGPRFTISARGVSDLVRELSGGVTLVAYDDLVDVIYSLFGYSPLLESGCPGVAVVVDVLHRQLPAALPVEEVNLREQQFQRLTQLPGIRLQCISAYTRDCLRRHFGVPADRCFVTALPVHARFGTGDAPAAVPAHEKRTFLYPANFWPHKNHEILLIAYRQYFRSSPDPWKLVLTGHEDARTRQVRAMARGLGIERSVSFPGHLDDQAFARLWSRVGALVFPSLHEGFAIPLLEAMQFGVPIVASNAGAIPETAGDAALLVDATSPAKLGQAMQTIADDAGLRDDLVARGRQRLALFSLAREVGTLASHLEAAAREAHS
ncbi:MAG TPA: glycosyltransferase family 1 protein [Opitutaceae bacterium]